MNQRSRKIDKSRKSAMRNLDEIGLSGRGRKRLGVIINAEFMPPDYKNTERAIRLNPAEALIEWLEEAAEEGEVNVSD